MKKPNTDAADEPRKLAYSIIEAASVAGIGRSTLYEALAAGELKAVRLGRRVLIPVDEMRRFIAALPAARPSNRCCTNSDTW